MFRYVDAVSIYEGFYPKVFKNRLLRDRSVNSRRQPLKGYYLGALLFTIQIIWIVLVPCLFYNSKNLNCIGVLFFLQFKEFQL